MDQKGNKPVIPLGNIVEPYGRIQMVGTTLGERYYWLEDKYGTISMMPADVIEERHMLMSRESTNKLIQMIEDGSIDKDTVLTACLSYMSEAEVDDMCSMNYFFEDEYDDSEYEEEEDD